MLATVFIPQAGFDPPGEKLQLRLNIVVALPPKPPRLDSKTGLSIIHLNWSEGKQNKKVRSQL